MQTGHWGRSVEHYSRLARREKMQTGHWGRSVEHYSRLALITSLS